MSGHTVYHKAGAGGWRPGTTGRAAEGFHRSDVAWALALALMALAPGVRYLIQHQTIIGAFLSGNSENVNEWMIYRQFINRSFAAGLLPAWTPQLLCGMPFIAWPHTSVFAPLGAIYALLPYSQATVVGLFIHAAIFTVSMYILLRLVPVRPLAAACAALVAYNFYIITESDHFLPRLFTFSWTPLLLACFLGLWRTRRMRFFLGAAILICLQELGGNVEMIVRQFLCLGTVVLGVAVFRPAELWRRRAAVLLILVSVAAGSFPGLIQSLPTFEFFHFSVRSSHKWFSYALYSSTTQAASVPVIWMFLTAVFPAVLALFVLELRRDFGPRVIMLALLANVVIAGNFMGVLRLFYHLPVLGNMMWHQLSFLYVYILAVILCALTLDHVLARADRPRYVLIIALSILAGGLVSLAESLTMIAGNLPFPANNIVAGQGPVAAALIAVALAGLAVYAFKLRWRAAPAALLLALAAVGYYLPSLSVLHHEDDSFPRYSSAYVNFFSRNSAVSRSMTVLSSLDWDHPSIPYQVGLVPGTETIDAGISSPLRWYAELYLRLLPDAKKKKTERQSDTTFWFLKNNYRFSESNLHLFNLLNVEYVSTLGVNLKFASHYYLAYNLLPQSCTGRPCALAGAKLGASGKSARLEAPSRWDQTLYLPPKAELRLGLEAPRPGAPVMFEAAVAGADDGSQRLIYARAPDPGRMSLPVRVGLASLPDRTVTLSLRATPVGDLPWPGQMADLLQEPLIFNPDANFRHLDLAGVDIFRNTGALPRAFVTHRFRVIAGKLERLDYLAGPQINPSSEVVLEKKVPELDASGRDLHEPVKVMLYRPGKVILSTDLAEEGFLFISDTYCPGWTATVGGVPQRILRADHAFQAVRLGLGPSQVTLTYRPSPLRIGIWASLAGAFCLAFLLAVRLAGPHHAEAQRQ